MLSFQLNLKITVLSQVHVKFPAQFKNYRFESSLINYFESNLKLYSS